VFVGWLLFVESLGFQSSSRVVDDIVATSTFSWIWGIRLDLQIVGHADVRARFWQSRDVIYDSTYSMKSS
jgi:hypothetical protein